MKVSQSGTFQELLKFLEVQSQNPSSAMMKSALMMRTATGKEDPELPLLQRIYRRYAYLVKDQVHIMARTAQISKEKRQSIITLRHEGQSMRKISRTLKVSSSAVTKTIKRNDETSSHEDRHRKGRPRVTYAAEDNFIIFYRPCKLQPK